MSDLLRKVPEFRPTYDARLRDYGERLEHVLAADLTRFAIDAFRREESRDVFVRIVELLESAMKEGDERVQELISVSFLENLGQADADYAEIKSRLGPNLSDQLARFENWSCG